MCRRGNGLAAESQVEDFDRDPTMWLGAQSGRWSCHIDFAVSIRPHFNSFFSQFEIPPCIMLILFISFFKILILYYFLHILYIVGGLPEMTCNVSGATLNLSHSLCFLCTIFYQVSHKRFSCFQLLSREPITPWFQWLCCSVVFHLHLSIFPLVCLKLFSCFPLQRWRRTNYQDAWVNL